MLMPYQNPGHRLVEWMLCLCIVHRWAYLLLTEMTNGYSLHFLFPGIYKVLLLLFIAINLVGLLHSTMLLFWVIKYTLLRRNGIITNKKRSFPSVGFNDTVKILTQALCYLLRGVNNCYLMRTPSSSVRMLWNKFTWTTKVLWRKRDDTGSLWEREHLGHSLKGRAPQPLAWQAFIGFLIAYIKEGSHSLCSGLP